MNNKKPLNAKTILGKPMLFAVMSTQYVSPDGDATIEYNIMSGEYLVSGQKGNPMGYYVKSLNKAISLDKTINHYNETNEIKKFN